MPEVVLSRENSPSKKAIHDRGMTFGALCTLKDLMALELAKWFNGEDFRDSLLEKYAIKGDDGNIQMEELFEKVFELAWSAITLEGWYVFFARRLFYADDPEADISQKDFSCFPSEAVMDLKKNAREILEKSDIWKGLINTYKESTTVYLQRITETQKQTKDQV